MVRYLRNAALVRGVLANAGLAGGRARSWARLLKFAFPRSTFSIVHLCDHTAEPVESLTGNSTITDWNP
jgi:hypothetical protein